jgi:predicted porin
MQDYGLMADTNAVASAMSDVAHSFLWNGIGASYRFTPVIEGSIYTRNLLRTDESSDYKMTTMYFSLEIKSTFHLSPNVEAYGGITWHYTGRTTSASIAQESKEFGAENPAKETQDLVNVIQIPVGITVKLQ